MLVIFIYMTKKTKQLRIRITEAQFKKVADALITGERNKSTLVRRALNYYLNKDHVDNTKKEQ
jgi:hypothetical protein